ncbi:hypothetical protein NSP_1090 [Nodularia spumigena CCY9414]|nr:hypothetical protein NSP_1090 [Nodularia spumigena CCY9414]
MDFGFNCNLKFFGHLPYSHIPYSPLPTPHSQNITKLLHKCE